MRQFFEKLSVLSLSLMLVSIFAPSTALPQMIRHYESIGYTASNVEVLFSISSIAVLIVLVITPRLSRLLSDRGTISLGLSLLSVGGSLPFVTQVYAWVVASRLLLGFGIGLINARVITIISERYTGKERMQMLGLRSSFEVLGSAVLTFLVGIVVGYGWRYAFLVYLMGLPILAFYLIYGPKPAHPTKASLSPSTEKFSLIQLRDIIGKGGLAGFVIAINCSNSLRIPILVDRLGLGSAVQASWILTAMMLMGILAGACFRWLWEKCEEKLLPLAFFLMALSLLFIGLGDNLWIILVGAMGAGFIYSTVVISVFNLISERVPKEQLSTATTLVLICCNLGGASAAYILRVFALVGSSPIVSFIIYAVLSCLVGCFLLLRQWQSAMRKQ